MEETINPIKRSYTPLDNVLNTYSEHKTVRFVPDQELLDAFSGLGSDFFEYCYAGDTPLNGEPTSKYNAFCEEMTPKFMCFG